MIISLSRSQTQMIFKDVAGKTSDLEALDVEIILNIEVEYSTNKSGCSPNGTSRLASLDIWMLSHFFGAFGAS